MGRTGRTHLTRHELSLEGFMVDGPRRQRVGVGVGVGDLGVTGPLNSTPIFFLDPE